MRERAALTASNQVNFYTCTSISHAFLLVFYSKLRALHVCVFGLAAAEAIAAARAPLVLRHAF